MHHEVSSQPSPCSVKKSKAKLELLMDNDMHLFVEQGTRGGILMASKRHAKANKYVEGYSPSKPPVHIAYLNPNNLYSWAMCFPLSISRF